MSNSPLPSPQTLITTHNSLGQSIFSTDIPSQPHWKPIGPTQSTFADIHVTPSLPADLSLDLAATAHEINTNALPAHLIQPNGIRFCVTNTPPGQVSPMHRTLSIDYGCVVSGSIELMLESGERRVLQAGDTFVQRATMHQWRNPSATDWCRMVCVLVPIQEGTAVAGKVLEEEFRVPAGVGRAGSPSVKQEFSS